MLGLRLQPNLILQLRAQNLSVSIGKPSEDDASRVRQLRTITAAYKAVASAEPLLPSPDSPLPALLALRSALKLVDQSKISIRGYRLQIIEALSRLRQEISDLKDTRQMNSALQHRVEILGLEKAEMAQNRAEDTAAKFLQAQQQRQLRYANDLKYFVVAFNKFVNEHLATLIAAEQLGGPVVGDDTSINEEMLRSGFTKLGKVKKIKVPNKAIDEGKADIDEDDSVEAIPGTESRAAGAGFRKLTEELLNALADEDNQDSYIAIRKETAAVRFLVRAKVAQFHPMDARKLRLTDFGAELEDDP